MVRLLALVVVASLVAVAGAAPVPKQAQERDEVIRLFGTPNDPSKDAEFAVEGKKLLIKLPKAAGPTRIGALPFPHTMRPVSGDFVLQVKVSYPLPEKVPALGAGKCAAGGLFIWGDENNNVLFHRHHQPSELADGTTKWDTAFCIEYNRGVKSQHYGNYGGLLEAPPVYLRITREKGVISPAYSYDGERWTKQQSEKMEFPEKVQVGVYAYRTAGEATAVTFEGLTITPIEKPKE